MTKTKTTTIRYWNSRVAAYAERIKTWNPERQDYSAERIQVYVYDDVAGHYTTCHSLTEGQKRYVIGRTLDRQA